MFLYKKFDKIKITIGKYVRKWRHRRENKQIFTINPRMERILYPIITNIGLYHILNFS